MERVLLWSPRLYYISILDTHSNKQNMFPYYYFYKSFIPVKIILSKVHKIKNLGQENNISISFVHNIILCDNYININEYYCNRCANQLKTYSKYNILRPGFWIKFISWITWVNQKKNGRFILFFYVGVEKRRERSQNPILEVRSDKITAQENVKW